MMHNNIDCIKLGPSIEWHRYAVTMASKQRNLRWMMRSPERFSLKPKPMRLRYKPLRSTKFIVVRKRFAKRRSPRSRGSLEPALIRAIGLLNRLF